MAAQGVRAGREGPHAQVRHRLHRRRHDHGRMPSRRLQGGRLPGGGDRLAHPRQRCQGGRALGHPDASTTRRKQLIEDPGVEILDLAFPPDQQPGADPPRAEAAAHQGHPGAEAAGAVAGGGDQAARRGRGCRQGPVGQPEHALRPVDAGAEADHRRRRPRRDRLRADRHARHPALADLPRGLRPADARQHERAPPRRAALPVRRSRARSPRSPARTRARRSPIPTASPYRRSGFRPACSRCRWRTFGRARARRATSDDQHIHWRVDGTEGVAKGTIGWPTGSASTLTYASTQLDRRRVGRRRAGRRCGSRTPSSASWSSSSTPWRAAAPPALSVADNVKTMALVEAGYRSIDEGRTVKLSRNLDPTRPTQGGLPP